MNLIQDCVAKVKQVGEELRVALFTTDAQCQCGASAAVDSTPPAEQCNCEQDVCRIGEVDACKPRPVIAVQEVTL